MGARDRLRLLRGILPPEEISKRTLPLGYVFASFLRKKKGCAGVGGMSPQNENLDAALFRGRNERFGTLLRTEDSANLSFVELRAPHRGIFPFTRKDTKGVSKGLPLRYPLGEVTVKVGGANQYDAPSP